MNSCGVQQNAEMKRSSVVSDRRDTVLCPKPRRVGVHSHHLARSLRWQVSHQMEFCESNSGSEILDFILAKGGGECEQDPTRKVTSSPPLFFTGSPPSRVSNPLTKDSLFRDELLVVATPPSAPRATKPPPPSSPRNGGGCVRAARNNPPVRVVGFNCLDRDRRSSVPTLA
ncbi:hypothetical protein EUTSA_v10008925mg [Eutrema salsugineum]|uniref:Uncharacterized protein n=1 Tax=Eutrema salsugineum TaxID=72664 RepID=V4KVW9_EUTSA|nr:uncharacterized protein LOC18993531 [Eutrema salsugineum]XP_024007690.1 uncharacterized protein LOC18993531 [Eutrema salsugineum]ESQ35479.1 hypothetical protein EUTSA_v10008925mg [Eutrema salsugineum]